MYNFTYETQGSSTYLVYEIAESDVIDKLALGMLSNNKIKGLASVQFGQMDTKRFVKFNVSAKVSGAQVFSEVVSKKRLLGILQGIVDAMISAEEYMIDMSSLLLDVNYIFTDVSTSETDLICLPIIQNEFDYPSLWVFFRNIMFTARFDQSENCDYVARIINFLNDTTAPTLGKFKELLKNVSSQGQPAVITTNFVSQEKQAQNLTRQQNMAVTNPPTSQKQTTQEPSEKPITPAPVTVKQESVQPPVVAEPHISFMYLMQHYNKENAAIYKAQQEAKKAQKAQNAQNEEKAVETKKKKTPAKKPSGTPANFAIPGMQEPVQVGGDDLVTDKKPVVSTAVSQPTYQQPIVATQVPTKTQPQNVVQSQPISFGETTVLGGTIGETTVLGAVATSSSIEPYLIRMKNNERIPLNKPVFRIGKERSYVDYFVGDNTAVSRSHANVITRDGSYFVMDTNSTNHTFVNGQMIPSNQEVPLQHDDKIRLANEDFEFKLY